MSKIIVYHEGPKVVGYEVVEPGMVEAARRGLSGNDAATFCRAIRQLGLEDAAKQAPAAALTAAQALKMIADTRGRPFVVVNNLPTVKVKRPDGTEIDDVDFDRIEVVSGKVVAKAAA